MGRILRVAHRPSTKLRHAAGIQNKLHNNTQLAVKNHIFTLTGEVASLERVNVKL